MISVSVRRSGTLATRLQEALLRVGRRVDYGCRMLGESILERSRLLVPRDTYTLFKDGHVRQEGFGLVTQVVVGYGTYGVTETAYSPAEGKVVIRVPSEYAIYVHEVDTHHHPIGQSNFLGEVRDDYATNRTVLRAAL